MKTILLAASIATTALFSVSSLAEAISTKAVTANQQQKIMEISALLTANPDIINGLHSNLIDYIDGQESINKVLKDNHQFLYNNPQHPYLGADSPTLTIISFTDYNCPYCKRLESGLISMVEKYPQLRVVNVLLPFQQRMTPGTQTNTAWYAQNVWENNRSQFAKVHEMMMNKPSKHDKASLMKIAQLTHTEDDLKPNNQKVSLVKQSEHIFRQLGLNGTPSLIINDEIIPGFIPEEQLEAIIKAHIES